MTIGSYRQFCPVAMAAEILCTRWTVVLLRELIAGSTRFNELRRGVPRMSPALLSQRLKELEVAGIIARISCGPASGCATLDVGHAPESKRNSDAGTSQRGAVRLSRTYSNTAVVVVDSRSPGGRRSLLDRSGV